MNNLSSFRTPTSTGQGAGISPDIIRALRNISPEQLDLHLKAASSMGTLSASGNASAPSLPSRSRAQEPANPSARGASNTSRPFHGGARLSNPSAGVASTASLPSHRGAQERLVNPSARGAVPNRKQWVKDVEWASVLVHMDRLPDFVSGQYAGAEAYFASARQIPVDYLRGKVQSFDAATKEQYHYCCAFVKAYVGAAMLYILKEQKLQQGSNASAGTVDSESAFRYYYLRSKGSTLAMAAGYYVTYGWWTDEVIAMFQSSLTHRFCLLYPNLQLLSGRNGRCAKNFLDKIFTIQKTKYVDRFRSCLTKGKGKKGLRIWMKNNKNGDSPFCFEAKCHYRVIVSGISFSSREYIFHILLSACSLISFTTSCL